MELLGGEEEGGGRGGGGRGGGGREELREKDGREEKRIKPYLSIIDVPKSPTTCRGLIPVSPNPPPPPPLLIPTAKLDRSGYSVSVGSLQSR